MTSEPPRGDGGRVDPPPYDPRQYPTPYDAPLPNAPLPNAPTAAPGQASPYAPTPYPPPQQDQSYLRSFEAPLPEAPSASAVQWGQPLSSAAPAPKAPPPAPRSRLAVATLVVGLLGGIGISLVMGIAALVRMRGGRRRGAGLAVIGILAGTAWGVFAAGVYLNVIAKPQVRDAAGVVVNRGEVSVSELRVGDCIEKWEPSISVKKIPVVPCAQNHAAEVYHTYRATGGDTFPGDQALASEASTQCPTTAKKKIKAADLKTARIAFLAPVHDVWGGGQRDVACVAVLPKALGRSVRT